MSSIEYHPPKALTKLIAHFKGKHHSWDKVCLKISKKLDNEWGASHIYDIYKGRSPSTPKFKDKINQLAYTTFNPERFWLSIHALTKEQKDRWKQVPMEVRRTFLDLAYNRWARDNLKCTNACDWVRPYGWTPEDGCPIHDPYPPEKAIDSPE